MDPLKSISPLDGRYASQLSELNQFFSDFAYFKYRLRIEIEYLLFLASEKIISPINKTNSKKINSIWEKFNFSDAKKISEIEQKIKHDVKAVEYFLQEKLGKNKLKDLIPYLHIGLTSDDINNLAYGLMLADSKKTVILPELKKILLQLKNLIKNYRDTPILGRTHGQPAVPTTFGKELTNFFHRLEKQQAKLRKFAFEGKLNGAVGNFNALDFAFPKTDWIKISKKFISGLGLKPNIFTTQILAYDNWIEYFQILSMINQVMQNFCQDIWMYIMLDDLKLKINKHEVGSSTMPQKVNPIDFENAEGNLQLSNSLFQFFQNKLTVTRLQRDLSDATVRRNFGVGLGYSLLAWKSLQKGLNKITVNTAKTKGDLNSHWEVLTEAIQTHLRLKNDSAAYDKVKKLVRGRQMNKGEYLKLLKQLGLDKEEKLTKLKPEKYLGLAKKLANFNK